MSEAPKLDRTGLALRAGVFVLIGWIGMIIFPFLLYPIAGLLVTAALSVFSAALVANVIPIRIFERGNLSNVGLGWRIHSGREFLVGAAVSGTAGVLVAGLPLITGMAHFIPAERVEHPMAALAFVALTLLFGAVGEELMFHGYAFQVLAKNVGWFATLLPTSVIFGLVHLNNQNANMLGILNTVLWGGVLGFAYLRTGSLWMPIGMHFGWNLSLPLLGANLSGFTMGVTGYALEWRAGVLWSGGGYGPEGGLVTTAAAVGLIFLLPRLTPQPDDPFSGQEVESHADTDAS